MTVEERFLLHVKKSDYCWEWIGGKNKDGYGIFRDNKKRYFSHRFSYSFYVDNNIDNLVVRHKCDNPSCVNPNHLLLGTHNDNVQDRVARNRSAIGEENGRSKLTESDVRFILSDTNLSMAELSRQFSVDQRIISKIKNRQLWKYIEYDNEIIIPSGVLKGSKNHSAKLTEEQVIDIRKKILNGDGCRKLGREYGISHTVISDIKNNKTWKNII